MNRFRVLLFGLVLSLAWSQEETSSKIYWNSLSTAVNVGVPLADDESLRGGRIQIRISFNSGKTFSNLGNSFVIEKGDINDLKNVSIPGEVFESMPGFTEGGEAQFIAEIWDKAGNSILGEVSDSILTIDQTIPMIEFLEANSSNSLDPTLAMSGDSITFQLKTSEPILSPIFEINGDDYSAAGDGKTWMTVYPADEADDGPIEIIVTFYDLAENPGVPAIAPNDGNIIKMDGTSPELDNISIFTSNQYDSLLAVKSDSVFLEFTASETIRDIEVKIDSVVCEVFKDDSLTFTYYHVFTESDSEGVVPISIKYNDLAGNVGEAIGETSDDSEVTFDMTPPATFKVESVESLQGEIESRVITEADSSNVNESTLLGLSVIPKLYLMIAAGILGLFCLLIWVSWFKIFSKAGQAGWKALVPFFNLFVFTKIVEKPIWWIAIYCIAPVGWIMAALQISNLFGKKIVFALGLIFLPFVFYPILAFGKSQVGEPISSPEPKPKKKEKKLKKKKK